MLRVTAVCIGSTPEIRKEPVTAAVLGRHGLEGDRHATETVKIRAGKRKGEVIFNERQWSAIGDEEMAELGKTLGVVLPIGALGENFRLTGQADLTHLPFGSSLRFPSGAVLLVSGQNLPCQRQADYLAGLFGMPELARSFVKAAADLRGIVGWIETPGAVAPGDQVTLEIP